MQRTFDVLGILLLFGLGVRLTPETEEYLFRILAESLSWVLRLFQ